MACTPNDRTNRAWRKREANELCCFLNGALYMEVERAAVPIRTREGDLFSLLSKQADKPHVSEALTTQRNSPGLGRRSSLSWNKGRRKLLRTKGTCF